MRIAEYQSDWFFEISIIFDCTVDDDISNRLRANDKDARETLLAIAKENEQLFEKVIDVISGLVGLKIHRQFILKPLVQSAFVSSGSEPVNSFAGDFVEMLENIQLNKSGEDILAAYLNSLEQIREDNLAKAGSVLHWLLRAWREHDSIAKFVYLFIPLEVILEPPTGTSPEVTEHLDALTELVTSSNREDKEKLLSFIETTRVKYGPTHNFRFEEFAKATKIPGWEDDIKAFKKVQQNS